MRSSCCRASTLWLCLALAPPPCATYTFLPYGSNAPAGVAPPPHAACHVPDPGGAPLFAELAATAGCEVVRDEALGRGRLLLLRATRAEPEAALSRLRAAAAQAAVVVWPIDAGPFGSRLEAAAATQTWLDEFWMCTRDEAGTASCFEYGGCHKRCWWREQAAAPPEVEVELLGHAAGGDDAPWEAALDRLGRHAPARGRAAGGAADLPSLPTALRLVACFVACADGAHYCSLRPEAKA